MAALRGDSDDGSGGDLRIERRGLRFQAVHFRRQLRDPQDEIADDRAQMFFDLHLSPYVMAVTSPFTTVMLVTGPAALLAPATPLTA
jgi:hypothetical protein